MKQIIAVLLLFFLLSCSNKSSLPRPFSSDMLASQEFFINNGSDTLIETLHGSVIRIKEGSFNISGTIKLQIKEAFTAAEILASGLTTESNGRPLRSGGMIYINATAAGEAVELLKPIKVSIPNQYYDSAMQIFKGVETDSSGINWIDPISPDNTEQSNQWRSGKDLFMSKCASCHNIFKNSTGPALKDVELRGPWTDRNNLYSYIHNPPAFIAKNSYSQALKNQYGSMMSSFPDITIRDIDAILDYIKNESNKPENATDALLNLDIPADSVNIFDKTTEMFKRPCKDDTIYQPIPKPKQSFFNVESEIEQPAMSESFGNDTIPQNNPVKASDMESLRGGFTDRLSTNGMYDFEIKTFGWYNVDAFVEGYDGTSNVKLYVQLQMELDISMHVYLFCPDKKLLSVMNEKRGDQYYFNKINDGIPLFMTDRAVVFAFGSKDKKIYYGINEFSVQGEQTISVRVKESSVEEITQALFSKQLDGIDLGIEKKVRKIIKHQCDDPLPADTLQ